MANVIDSRCPGGGRNPYCANCDCLLGIEGAHVVGATLGAAGRVVTVVTAPRLAGCLKCGVVAVGHGRLAVNLVDAPWAGIPTNIIWRKRRFRCAESKCPVVTFTEENRGIAPSRALLTARAARWAVGQMRRENASVRGLARQMGTAWQTVWSAVEPILEAAADDESRFAGVEALGVDEHVWHHGDQRVRGSRYFTGMTDLTRHTDPKTGKKQVRARLLDLVGGRSGPVLGDWLKERGEQWRADVKVAAIESLSDCLCKRWIVNFD